MVAEIVTAGTDINIGVPRVLFAPPSPMPVNMPYDVASDGRFLVLQIDDSAEGAASFTVELNWQERVER